MVRSRGRSGFPRLFHSSSTAPSSNRDRGPRSGSGPRVAQTSWAHRSRFLGVCPTQDGCLRSSRRSSTALGREPRPGPGRVARRRPEGTSSDSMSTGPGRCRRPAECRRPSRPSPTTRARACRRRRRRALAHATKKIGRRRDRTSTRRHPAGCRGRGRARRRLDYRAGTGSVPRRVIPGRTATLPFHTRQRGARPPAARWHGIRGCSTPERPRSASRTSIPRMWAPLTSATGQSKRNATIRCLRWREARATPPTTAGTRCHP